MDYKQLSKLKPCFDTAKTLFHALFIQLKDAIDMLSKMQESPAYWPLRELIHGHYTDLLSDANDFMNYLKDIDKVTYVQYATLLYWSNQITSMLYKIF